MKKFVLLLIALFTVSMMIVAVDLSTDKYALIALIVMGISFTLLVVVVIKLLVVTNDLKTDLADSKKQVKNLMKFN